MRVDITNKLSREFLIDFVKDLKVDIDAINNETRDYVSRQEVKRECLINILTEIEKHLQDMG